MAFLNLRPNSQIYILHKDNIPKLEVGKVLTVSLPIPKYGNFGQELVVDIAVNVDGTINNLQKLPAAGEIADLNLNVVVSSNKDAINNEILAMKTKSEDIINSIDLHKAIVEACTAILQMINPEIAEKKLLELQTQELKKEINDLKELVKQFINGNNNRTN